MTNNSGRQGNDRHRDLSGAWVATRPTESLRRAYPDADHDDSDWAPIEVPGLWRHHDDFVDAEELLYRTKFSTPQHRDGTRVWLGFGGICYQSDVWLDGTYLGDTEGYFAPHVFEITEHATEQTEHTLALEVSCRRPSDLTAKRNITGVLQHWDNISADLNPGGIWRKVWIEETGPIRISALRVTVVEADAERAIIAFHATLDSVATHTVELKTFVDASTAAVGTGSVAHLSDEHVLSAGENQLEWRVAVEQPDLWWPRSLGEPTMHDVRVEVRLAGITSHIRKRRIGLRSIELRNWIASINGERLQLKGTNIGPLKADLSSVTPADIERTLNTVIGLGLDIVRVHGHVEPVEFYRAADRLGVLVWQDFPLQWGYAKGIRAQAERQAQQMVNLLAHHPSIVVWCGHNEPVALDARAGHRPDVEPQRRFFSRSALQHELPSWNRTVLDRAVKRAIRSADASRPVIAHSGVLPHPPQLDGTDSHLYFGWYQGSIDGLADLARKIPRLVRFVSEFGAQSVPDLDSIGCGSLAALAPHQIDWDDLASRFGLQVDIALARIPANRYATFGEWAEATRWYQSEVITRQVETLRRLKYRPNGGFMQFHLADDLPSMSTSIIDHLGNELPGADALRAACRPVLPLADPLPPVIAPGATQRQRLYVVSDLRYPIDDARLDVTLRSSEGERRWRFNGAVAQDDVVKIGDISWALPATAGDIELKLSLTSEGLSVVNRYSTRVDPSAGHRR